MAKKGNQKMDVQKLTAPRGVVERIRANIDGIVAQRDDPGLEVGRSIISQMDLTDKEVAFALSESVGQDLVRALRMFSSDGRVGSTLSRIAPRLVGNNRINIPSLDSLSGDDNPELLLAALFDPRFQKSLYYFQLLLSKSSLLEQQQLVRKFKNINWAKFSAEDRGWFANTIGLISAGPERSRVMDLRLEDVIPLMMVPKVLDITTISVGYAEIMDAALSSYYDHSNFLKKLGGDNSELLKEIDALLLRITNAEESRLKRFGEVKEATEVLTRLMESATLIAELTNRTTEAKAMKDAGDNLARALKGHSEDTLESQEAYLQQFMLLNQILVSNQVREGHLSSAMASLSLYVKAYQAFVLILTVLQVYLLTASTALKKYLSESLEGQVRNVVDEIYRQSVSPMNRSLNLYAKGFATKGLKPSLSEKQSVLEDVVEEV